MLMFWLTHEIRDGRVSQWTLACPGAALDQPALIVQTLSLIRGQIQSEINDKAARDAS